MLLAYLIRCIVGPLICGRVVETFTAGTGLGPCSVDGMLSGAGRRSAGTAALAQWSSSVVHAGCRLKQRSL